MKKPPGDRGRWGLVAVVKFQDRKDLTEESGGGDVLCSCTLGGLTACKVPAFEARINLFGAVAIGTNNQGKESKLGFSDAGGGHLLCWVVGGSFPPVNLS